ncbi:uncharacterized protein ATC70_002449 [Mucor velutinosus]|uniref:Uncharacterized protein n=1 Tax=Mucor velutinosus TaxID=708070 RepID=A0AAN7DE29_9FUNG|nr:hypothetical protein ATC70_002449 [Mucor velutinosus]
MSDATKITKKNDDKIKQMSVIGLSVYAVVHSHLYWVYSILYIAYHQITPHKKPLNAAKWRFPDSTHKKSKKKHPHQKHSKKKSLTHKPKAIIPSTKPKTAVIALTTKTTHIDDAKHALVQQQQKVPLFHALRTFPSSSSKNPLNIHQLIKSHRKIPKRSNSTGHLNAHEALLPPSLVNSEEDTSSDESSIHIQTLSPNKRSRALGLLRSTFQRSNSTGHLKQGLNSSFSSLSEDEEVVIEVKKRKRDTLFGITRKFSSRKNVPTLATTTTTTTAAADQHPKETSPPSETKNSTTTRSKLFRNMPSWKKQSQAVAQNP